GAEKKKKNYGQGIADCKKLLTFALPIGRTVGGENKNNTAYNTGVIDRIACLLNSRALSTKLSARQVW
ncbi:hypothetical protein, partial [Pontibacter deserti]|uniref:hypothetical protein n=1 Tax=Pontibacter sp. KCTC 32443 TaxID=2764721 RepID=UPI001C9A7642